MRRSPSPLLDRSRPRPGEPWGVCTLSECPLTRIPPRGTGSPMDAGVLPPNRGSSALSTKSMYNETIGRLYQLSPSIHRGSCPLIPPGGKPRDPQNGAPWSPGAPIGPDVKDPSNVWRVAAHLRGRTPHECWGSGGSTVARCRSSGPLACNGADSAPQAGVCPCRRTEGQHRTPSPAHTDRTEDPPKWTPSRTQEFPASTR